VSKMERGNIYIYNIVPLRKAPLAGTTSNTTSK